ncbi:MAG: serine hydrolase [Pyrinomonadaceae bacterium]|nr:serine hydrolase [Pyrinomonadaceae bacterium]
MNIRVRNIKISRSLIAAFFTAVFVVSGIAQSPAAGPDIRAKVDEYMNARLDAKGFGGAVLFVKDGNTVAGGGYGFADLEAKSPIKPDTKFRIGSVTKQFTAALVLMLQEEGKLNVQDPVCKYLDPCPEAWQPVTIHHLLSMSSGITSITSLPNWRNELRFKDLTPAEVIAMTGPLPLKAKPGDAYEYSNTNYIVLGTIVEKLSGKTYEQFLTERIIKPLGLKDTGLDNGKTRYPNSALGYTMKNGVISPADPVSVTISFSAGAMYSTPGDLHKWQMALLGGRVYKKEETLAAMLTPNKGDYGYGLIVVTDRKGRKRITHGGGIEGFITDSVYFPEEKLFIAAFTNNDRNAMGELMGALTAIPFGEPYALPKKRVAIKLDAAILDKYVGEYQLAPTMSFKIERGPDGLTMEPTRQPKAPLFAESETEFFLTVVDATLKFVKDEAGKVTGLEFTQAGRTMKAARK